MKKIFISLIILMFLSGCGYIVVETIPMAERENAGKGIPIIVLPFSDYSGLDVSAMSRRAALLNDSINSSLVRHGFLPAVQDDVINFLIEKGVIKRLSTSTPYKEEYLKDYSREMKEFVANLYKQENPTQKNEFVALNEKLLLALKDRFNSRYVLRGRIHQMGIQDLDTINPVQAGILPFVFKTGSRIVFGVGSTETYEALNNMAVGAVLGGAFAQETFPLDPKRFDAKDRENIKDINRGVWLGGGPGLGWLSHKSGKVSNAVVHLEMVLQDAVTGAPLWSNRIGVEVSPESSFYLGGDESLLKAALEYAVERLIEDLTVSFNGRS